MVAETKPTCGIVMPISAIDGCDESHWADVLKIITDSASSADFNANIVSNSDDVGVIQKRIVQNLYENEIVVCDVSGKNPNVMFELGMRLAFDKPTIIIKDDKTAYSFDTSPIEHITYPRDLRFSKIVEFKEKLALKIKATHHKSKTDREYSPFLKHFGDFKVAKIDTKEISAQDYIIEELRSLRFAFERSNIRSNKLEDLTAPVPRIVFNLKGKFDFSKKEEEYANAFLDIFPIEKVKFTKDSDGRTNVSLTMSRVMTDSERHSLIKDAKELVKALEVAESNS